MEERETNSQQEETAGYNPSTRGQVGTCVSPAVKGSPFPTDTALPSSLEWALIRAAVSKTET